MSQEEEPNDTDFDFGDLVTMTIIDVFETDNDGKLLSYCPTFDNRAVHKTQESIERLRKGASQLREIARSPAGVKVNKVSPQVASCLSSSWKIMFRLGPDKITHS